MKVFIVLSTRIKSRLSPFLRGHFSDLNRRPLNLIATDDECTKLIQRVLELFRSKNEEDLSEARSLLLYIACRKPGGRNREKEGGVQQLNI